MKQIALLAAFCPAVAYADPPEITSAVYDGNGRVSVTIAHPDTGWDHYADGWRVKDGDGNVLGTRELLHPHVNEQPFTRSLGGLDLPEGPLFVRAKCSVDGWSEDVVALER